ncbi:MAG: hypothetical protein ACOCUZ_02850 [bacterium]
MERRAARSRRVRAYRDLAWERARSHLWDGRRRDGPWEYYETMLEYEMSGRFDLDPASERLVPETDPATFNGRIWELARELHLPGGVQDDPDPESEAFRRALDYYRERAVRPEYAWDWRGDEESRRRFSSLIRRSDEAARAATAFIGLLLVNRFVSAVDAYLSGGSGSSSVRAASGFRDLSPTQGVAWELRIRVFWPPGTSDP